MPFFFLPVLLHPKWRVRYFYTSHIATQHFKNEPHQNARRTHNLALSEILETICEKLDIELVALSGNEPYFTELMETFTQF
jgi:hypothetical protein